MSVLETLEDRVQATWEQTDWPNPPSIETYVKHAEALGLTTQKITDGLYYTVYALYDDPYVFGREPLALVFEDNSKSYSLTLVMKPA